MCKWRTDRDGRQMMGEEGRGKREKKAEQQQEEQHKKTSSSMGDKQFEKLRVWLIRIKLI